jgi:hypothetical protein
MQTPQATEQRHRRHGFRVVLGALVLGVALVTLGPHPSSSQTTPPPQFSCDIVCNALTPAPSDLKLTPPAQKEN